MTRELTMPPLLPCPFCGGPARVIQQNAEVDRSDGQGVVIECENFLACRVLVKAAGNRFEAAQKWNTRVAVSVPPEAASEGTGGVADVLALHEAVRRSTASQGEAEREPVAWMYGNRLNDAIEFCTNPAYVETHKREMVNLTPLYTLSESQP